MITGILSGLIPGFRGSKLDLSAALQEGGRVIAAVASQITDGSAALLVVSEAALKLHGLTPRARIHHLSVRGDASRAAPEIYAYPIACNCYT